MGAMKPMEKKAGDIVIKEGDPGGEFQFIFKEFQEAILSLTHFFWSGALDSSDVHLSYL